MLRYYRECNEALLLASVEDFVIKSISYQIPSDYEFKSRLLELIPAFKVFYRMELKYCSAIEVFASIVMQVEAMLGEHSYENIVTLSTKQIAFLKQLLFMGRTGILHERNTFSKQEKKNRDSLITYLTSLTGHYSKLLFIRIDLSYSEESSCSHIGIIEFNQHIATLRNRMANKDSCFKDLHGYAWALEQGQSKGYHCHLLLIYDGHKHQNDYGLGVKVEKLWSDITNGLGMGFICNHPAYKQKLMQGGCLGIGMIYRHDPQQVENAINAALYLVNPEKDMQHLRVKLPRMKTFGTGQFEVSWRRGIHT